MKNKLYIAALAVSSITLLSSCEDFLNLKSKTDITTDYLTTSPDGLYRAAIGLYSRTFALEMGRTSFCSSTYSAIVEEGVMG